MLLENQTENGVGDGVQRTGPCTIFVPNSSEFDGAKITFEVSDADNEPDYVAFNLGRGIMIRPGLLYLDIQGSYWLRADVTSAGDDTDLTAKIL